MAEWGKEKSDKLSLEQAIFFAYGMPDAFSAFPARKPLLAELPKRLPALANRFSPVYRDSAGDQALISS